MAKMGKCQTCHYWTHVLTFAQPSPDDTGRCRRYPPVPYPDPEDNRIVVVWPETPGWDGCGEWQENQPTSRLARHE